MAPGLLIMVTCFTRFVIALSFLRAGLGLQTTPANLILISLSLFMTLLRDGADLRQAWQTGVQPLMENKISEKEAYARIIATVPHLHARQRARQGPETLRRSRQRAQPDRARGDAEIDLRVLIPAFMISELRRGFEIGFLIVLPFLVIDMIVATLTMSMGMMMLPPTVISLPFKILFFVLIDGWNLLVGGLVRSFTDRPCSPPWHPPEGLAAAEASPNSPDYFRLTVQFSPLVGTCRHSHSQMAGDPSQRSLA